MFPTWLPSFRFRMTYNYYQINWTVFCGNACTLYLLGVVHNYRGTTNSSPRETFFKSNLAYKEVIIDPHAMIKIPKLIMDRYSKNILN